jgi:TolB protein
MNVNGSAQTRLTVNPALDANPAWSPDGRQIVFQSDRDGNTEVYVMNADGTGQRRLTRDVAVDQVPDWQPRRLP